MMANQTCATAAADCPIFNAPLAQTCIRDWAAETCAQIADSITPPSVTPPA